MKCHSEIRYWRFEGEKYSPLELNLREHMRIEIRFGTTKKRLKKYIDYGKIFNINLEEMEEYKQWKRNNALSTKLKRFLLNIMGPFTSA